MNINLTQQGEWFAQGTSITITTQTDESITGTHGFIEENITNQARLYNNQTIGAKQFYQI